MCASDGLRCILYLEIYANEYYGNFLLSSGLPQAGETPPGNEIIYICDFSRSEATNIDYFILWRLSLPAEVRLNFMFTHLLRVTSFSLRGYLRILQEIVILGN